MTQVHQVLISGPASVRKVGMFKFLSLILSILRRFTQARGAVVECTRVLMAAQAGLPSPLRKATA